MQILLYLRSNCFHDRRTGECRNHWQVSRAQIAKAVGVSEATVKRELLQNTFLREFVQPQQEYSLAGGRGGVRRDANSYRVAMDDPIHESDWPRVEAYVCEAEALRGKGGGAPMDEAEQAKQRARHQLQETMRAETDHLDQPSDRSASGQIDPAPRMTPSGQIDPTAKTASLRVKLTRPLGQIDPANSGRYLENTKNQESTLNVGTESTFVDVSEAVTQDAPALPKLRSKRTQILDKLVEGLVAELHDFGSERRHHQLLDICQQRNLDDLPSQALAATRKRLASEATQGPLERPGAYYQRILLALLEDHQVFVPKLGEPSAEEVHRIAMQSFEEAEKGA